MDNNKAIQAIELTISNRKNEVVKSLIDSNVFVPNGISDLELKNIILKQLKEGNGFLVFYLGQVIDKEFSNVEEKSNWIGAAIGLGSSLLGLATGGGGDDGKAQAQAYQQAQQAEAARQAALLKQMQIAQSQANAQKILAEANAKAKSASTTRTVIILSLVGVTTLIGITIVVLALKNKKK